MCFSVQTEKYQKSCKRRALDLCCRSPGSSLDPENSIFGGSTACEKSFSVRRSGRAKYIGKTKIFQSTRDGGERTYKKDSKIAVFSLCMHFDATVKRVTLAFSFCPFLSEKKRTAAVLFAYFFLR